MGSGNRHTRARGEYQHTMSALPAMFRGDTPIWQTTVTNKSDGTAFNLTGWTARMTAKRNKTDSDADAVFQLSTVAGTVTFPDGAAAGVLQSQPEREDTSDLTTELTLFWDIQIAKDGSPDQTFTVDSGTLQVRFDITRTAP